MTADRADALVVTEQLTGGGGRRIAYEPRSDGRVDRVEETLTDGAWREVGHEVIEGIGVESRATPAVRLGGAEAPLRERHKSGDQR